MAKQNQSIYISADSKVYPCPWVGQYPNSYKFNNFDNAIGPINNNAAELSIANAMEWFSKVEQSWQCKSIKEGMLATCVGCTKGAFYQET